MDTTVISGGGTGIGRAVARNLTGHGRHVTIVGRREQPLRDVAAENPELVSIVVADVSTVAGAAAVAEEIRAAGRDCVGVVAAAGGQSPQPGPADDLQSHLDGWQLSFESNVLSAVLLVEALRPSLTEHAGRVVLLSSVAALRGSRSGPYGAMKAALHAYTFDLARQLGPHGGTANAVAPGFVPDTEFWDGRLSEELVANRISDMFVKRGGTPEEIASLIAWLLGPDAGWVTAQILSPNGGVVLGR